MVQNDSELFKMVHNGSKFAEDTSAFMKPYRTVRDCTVRDEMTSGEAMWQRMIKLLN